MKTASKLLALISILMLTLSALTLIACGKNYDKTEYSNRIFNCEEHLAAFKNIGMNAQIINIDELDENSIFGGEKLFFRANKQNSQKAVSLLELDNSPTGINSGREATFSETFIAYFPNNAAASEAKQFCENDPITKSKAGPQYKFAVAGNVLAIGNEKIFDLISECFSSRKRMIELAKVSVEHKTGFFLKNHEPRLNEFSIELSFCDGNLKMTNIQPTDIKCNTSKLGKTIATVSLSDGEKKYNFSKECEVIDESHKYYFVIENFNALIKLGFKQSAVSNEIYFKNLDTKIGGYSKHMIAKAFFYVENVIEESSFGVFYFDTEENASKFKDYDEQPGAWRYPTAINVCGKIVYWAENYIVKLPELSLKEQKIANIPLMDVSFKADGNIIKETTIYSNTKEFFTPDAPIKEGYDFAGWYFTCEDDWDHVVCDTSVKADNIQHSDKGLWYAFKRSLLKDVTLIPKYTPTGNNEQEPSCIHSVSDWIIDTKPTCTEIGRKHKECSYCGENFDIEIIPLLGHDYFDGICIRCGEDEYTIYLEDMTGTNGLIYTLNKDKNGYSCSGIGIAADTDIIVASEYNGLPVTSISESAFFDCKSITSITIPHSVTEIGYAAFNNCNNLTSIIIGSGLEFIGDEPFSSCFNLRQIKVDKANKNYRSFGNCLIEIASKTLIRGCRTSVIPADGSVTSIGYCAFYGNADLTSIVIPDSVISISKGAFDGCRNLSFVKMSNNLKSIDISAFSECESLTSIFIPKTVNSIGQDAFSCCSNLEKVYYSGSNETWNNISIDMGNEHLLKANMYYYAETQPISIGNYWHYVDDVITEW